VIPVYNGATSIGSLVTHLHEDLARQYELEVVLVNDCNPEDNSADVCRKLARQWPKSVRFVNLSRNFGEHNAVMAGLCHCSGDLAVIMDDDFQNPPSEVIKLVGKLLEGYDVVFSCYATKKHHWLRNVGSRFNNAVASLMLKKPRNLYLSSFKAINRFVIDEITKYQGPYPYIDGLILRITRNYATREVLHDSREEGRSGYTLSKLIRLWLNMFTNFSILPLRVASVAGFVFALLGFLFALGIVVEWFVRPGLPVGWASTICVILIVSGVQLFALGMIGEYLGRLFLKDNGSPQFVVRETVNCGEQRTAQKTDQLPS
jgi:undecaprenyl-phosphate 4-deoxy-4-formamido-L-arabinose transferase